MDSIIFDVDGTLWDSTAACAQAWNEAILRETGKSMNFTEHTLKSLFGRLLPDIAKVIFPDCTTERQLYLIDLCCQEEHRALLEQCAPLYPNLEDTLQKLSEKYPLFIVSNCQDGYIQSFYSGNHTAKYFKDCECIGVTGKSKGANIRLVMERNGLKSPVYIGDTQGDADAAAQAGIPFIYAAYGFGQVKAFDAEIHTFEELLDIVE